MYFMLDKDTKKYLFFLYCYPKNVKPQNRIDFIGEVSPFSLDFCRQTRKSNYEQSILLCGRIFYSLVIKLLDKLKIFQISRKRGGEYYVKTIRWLDMFCRYALCCHHAFWFLAWDNAVHTGRSPQTIQAEARKLCHFSNIQFKGVERHPGYRQKEGGIFLMGLGITKYRSTIIYSMVERYFVY